MFIVVFRLFKYFGGTIEKVSDFLIFKTVPKHQKRHDHQKRFQ